jgi:hypothetical protein
MKLRVGRVQKKMKLLFSYFEAKLGERTIRKNVEKNVENKDDCIHWRRL